MNNPLWILEQLGPVVCEFTAKEGVHESDYDWAKWLMSETRIESIFVRELYPLTAFHGNYPHNQLEAFAANPYCLNFTVHAFNTIPPATPAHHALLDFMRYYVCE